MAATSQEQVDSLASLEDRISRTVELVAELRRENQELTKRLESVESDREGAIREAAEQNERLTQELEELRAERKQVRARIEKLLGQMDLLTAG